MNSEDQKHFNEENGKLTALENSKMEQEDESEDDKMDIEENGISEGEKTKRAKKKKDETKELGIPPDYGPLLEALIGEKYKNYEIMKEANIPSDYSNISSSGQIKRTLTDFIFVNYRLTNTSLDEIPRKKLYGVGRIVLPESSYDEKDPEESQIIIYFNIQEWMIDYGDSPTLWIRSHFAFYQLLHPHPSYESEFISIMKKFLMSTALSTILTHHPEIEYKVAIRWMESAFLHSGLPEFKEIKESDFVKHRNFLTQELTNIDSKLLNRPFCKKLETQNYSKVLREEKMRQRRLMEIGKGKKKRKREESSDSSQEEKPKKKRKVSSDDEKKEKKKKKSSSDKKAKKAKKEEEKDQKNKKDKKEKKEKKRKEKKEEERRKKKEEKKRKKEEEKKRKEEEEKKEQERLKELERKKYPMEDSQLKQDKELPDISVPLTTTILSPESLSQVFMICEFLCTFKDFLGLNISPSVVELISLINSSEANFELSQIYLILLRSVLDAHNIGLHEYSEFLIKISQMPLNDLTWPEILRQYLQVIKVQEEIYTKLKTCEYWKLSVNEKLTLLNFLCEELIESPLFREEISRSFEVIAGISKENWEEKRLISKRKKEREELSKNQDSSKKEEEEIEEELLSRTQILEKKKRLESEQKKMEKQELQKQKELLMEKKKVENFERVLEQKNFFIRTKPIGYDRFCNRYWYFNSSLGFCQGYVIVESENSKSWSIILKKEHLDQLISCLNVKGLREHSLHQKLKSKYALFEKAYKQPNSFVRNLLEQSSDSPIKEISLEGIYGEPSVTTTNVRTTRNSSRNKVVPNTTMEILREILLEVESKIPTQAVNLDSEQITQWKDSVESATTESELQVYFSEFFDNIVLDLFSVKLNKEAVESLQATRKEMNTLAQFALCLYQFRDILPSTDYDKVKCTTCKRSDSEDLMLLCDECDAGYHTFCLRPKLKVVPSGEWYCPKCMQK